MYCSNCGTFIDERSKFCSNCGSNISDLKKSLIEDIQTSNIQNHQITDVSTKFVMSDVGIQTLIKENMSPDETDSYYFYGVKIASIGNFLLIGPFASLTNKNFICNVTNKGIHLYGLSLLNKPKDYSFIPKNNIKNLQVKSSIATLGFAKNVIIEFKQGGKIELQATKNISYIKLQGFNLDAIANMFY